MGRPVGPPVIVKLRVSGHGVPARVVEHALCEVCLLHGLERITDQCPLPHFLLGISGTPNIRLSRKFYLPVLRMEQMLLYSAHRLYRLHVGSLGC